MQLRTRLFRRQCHAGYNAAICDYFYKVPICLFLIALLSSVSTNTLCSTDFPADVMIEAHNVEDIWLAPAILEKLSKISRILLTRVAVPQQFFLKRWPWVYGRKVPGHLYDECRKSKPSVQQNDSSCFCELNGSRANFIIRLQEAPPPSTKVFELQILCKPLGQHFQVNHFNEKAETFTAASLPTSETLLASVSKLKLKFRDRKKKKAGIGLQSYIWMKHKTSNMSNYCTSAPTPHANYQAWCWRGDELGSFCSLRSS